MRRVRACYGVGLKAARRPQSYALNLKPKGVQGPHRQHHVAAWPRHLGLQGLGPTGLISIVFLRGFTFSRLSRCLLVFFAFSRVVCVFAFFRVCFFSFCGAFRVFVVSRVSRFRVFAVFTVFSDFFGGFRVFCAFHVLRAFRVFVYPLFCFAFLFAFFVFFVFFAF